MSGYDNCALGDFLAMNPATDTVESYGSDREAAIEAAREMSADHFGPSYVVQVIEVSE